MVVVKMYRFLLTHKNIGKNTNIKNVWLERTGKIISRPYFYSLYSYSYYQLIDILHQWFIDHNIEYSLEGNNNETYIIFEKESDAVYFKLVWC
jgi:hypothetical protein